MGDGVVALPRKMPRPRGLAGRAVGEFAVKITMNLEIIVNYS